VLLALSEFLRMAGGEAVKPSETIEPARVSRLPSPAVDLAELTGRLAQAWGVTAGYPLVQYLAWGERAGIFVLLARHESLGTGEIAETTGLSESGVDALLPVFTSLGVVSRMGFGRYCLTSLGREYLLPDSPYYAGAGLSANSTAAIPAAYLRNSPTEGPDRRSRWPIEHRLEIQHSRNFAPAVVAARSGQFDGVRHLVDIGGGSGVLAIPLALDHPDMRITIVDRPEVVEAARPFLARYGVEERIRRVGMDIEADEWRFGPSDGVVFGNVFHGASDEECQVLSRKSFKVLKPGGRIWLHEVLFDEGRTGPLIAALWNANMAALKPGARQRTARELSTLLADAGFASASACPTAGGFSLVTAVKPDAATDPKGRSES
jgi:predicted O-methyltransferase YrrM